MDGTLASAQPVVHTATHLPVPVALRQPYSSSLEFGRSLSHRHSCCQAAKHWQATVQELQDAICCA